MAGPVEANTLTSCFTPCAVVDRTRLQRNIERMNASLAPFGVNLRPHVKTTKSVEISRLLTQDYSGAITVSTLSEAEYFADAGFTDILYAVGITPNKLDRIAALLDRGIAIRVILDSAYAAELVAQWGAENQRTIPVMIEINSDDHRAGIDPGDSELLATATILCDSDGTAFEGVMTHAGASYDCRSEAELRAMAKQERDAAVQCAEEIRAAGMECRTVSVGSTPTAMFATDLSGVTEVRAGVYPFMDLYQAGLQCCEPDDIALSVLTSVIGHKHRLNTLLTDAGGLALSKDRGTASQAVDQKYGLVCDIAGNVIDNLVVGAVNQEHGLITTRDGSPVPFDKLPVGTQLRILPNHSCMTAAAYSEYLVVDGDDPEVRGKWQRCGGWT